jgi:hypothetical protein
MAAKIEASIRQNAGLIADQILAADRTPEDEDKVEAEE